MSLVVLSATNWPFIQPHLPKLIAAIETAAPGSFTRIECGTFTRRKPGNSSPPPE